MHRPFFYPDELPMAEDFLNAGKFPYVALGTLIQAVIGRNVGVSSGDFAISATGPASMSVIIGTGSIYAMEQIDPNAYSTLGTDANQTMKQGILLAPTTIAITAPATSGFEQYYLIEAAFNEVDAGDIVPPFFNTANPEVPLNGAGGTGGSLPTVRQDLAAISLKAGAAAAVGSASVPAPDAGFVGLWVVHVINGQTTITSANWFQYASAPFFPNLESLYSIFQQIISVNTTYHVNNSIGNDTTGNGSAQFPWASIPHAISVITTYNLNGNTVTIQLGLTGVNYTGPGIFPPPSNGMLIIKGDAANQSGYTIALTPSTDGYVIGCSIGTLNLIGVTVTNIAGSSSTGAVGAAASGTLNLSNVTISTTATGSYALISASNGSSVGVGAGCIMGGSAQYMWFSQYGASITMAANVATASSPAFSISAAAAIGNGSIVIGGGAWTWTGSGATGPRYGAGLNGVINTNGAGANFFPGSAAGSTSTGGQYA